MSALQFEVLSIKNIVPDPNQPRKYYDEVAMQELTDSVRESGILQPILVREQPDRHDHYLIVCGERRYRASKAAGLKTIPAVIRKISDEEALQLQIVENLQRKDVHPMEEAVAFKSFIEGKNWSFDEIAKRVGKSDYYVKQRLKLNSLTERFQQLFYHNKMSISTALDVAKLEASTQEEMFAEIIGDADLKNPEFKLELAGYYLAKYQGKLKNANFDTLDKDLFPSMGPCDTCQFNSSALKLFPNDDQSATCGNIKCFKEKTERAFKINLEAAIQDPTILLVVTDYNPDKATKVIMSKYEGVLDRNSFTEEEEPEMQHDRSWYDGDNDTPEEDEADYQSDLRDYMISMQEWKDKIATGAYVKAFVIAGSGKGKYTYVKLKKSAGKFAPQTSASTTVEPTDDSSIKSATLMIADIDNEIARIKEKENRAKQIDENNIWDEVKKHFNPHANAGVLKDPLTNLERKAVAEAMCKKIGYLNNSHFRKMFGLDKDGAIEDTTFNQMCRFFMLDVLPPSACYSGFTDDANLCLEIAMEYFPGVLLEIQDTANLKTEKRIARIEKRIKELQDKKKEIKSTIPKPTKSKK